MLRILIAVITLATLIASCKSDSANAISNENYDGLTAANVAKPIVVDGIMENAWKAVNWQPIDQVWMGENLTAQDFKGQYKLLYDKDYLYVLANITDDRLIDEIEDGLKDYWHDDCLEVFIDEDRSKGNHTYSHNAFAYHIAIDGKVVDINPDSIPTYYNDHVKTARVSRGVKHMWEAAIKIYDDSYVDGKENKPQTLKNGKRMGFAIAYCDNDYSREREHFIGSTVIEGDDKNRGWIDAGVFEELRLVK